MIDFSDFFVKLQAELADTGKILTEKTNAALADMQHGHFDEWVQTIEDLPFAKPTVIELNSPAVTIGDSDDLADKKKLKSLLLNLHPWRKGPFNIFGINIDTEWRSDMKWGRLADRIAPLSGRKILDVGSGNGYYCLRALGSGAEIAVGVDPFLLFVMQFQAINKYLSIDNASVLPLGVEDVPADCCCFDTVFSMGVLYHRRQPLEHLKSLLGFLDRGGELVLETLIIEDDVLRAISPVPRYAKMRNVWQIPSPPLLIDWLKQAGFKKPQIIDIAKTTAKEQRKTEWMKFESLEDYLHPKDKDKTIEGYPAPVRAVVIAQKF